MPVIRFSKYSLLRCAVIAVALALPKAVLAKSSPGIVCSLEVTPLIFGEYLPYRGIPTDSTATLTVICINHSTSVGQLSGSITLMGATPSTNRQLRQGLQALRYQLYLDPARTELWGDGNNSLAISGTITFETHYRQEIMIYGRIYANQNTATANAYIDNINSTLDY